MNAPDPKVIRNRYKKSPLPRNWDIAEALREGSTTLEELAATHGVRVQSITKRLAIAGWDQYGHPIPPWREDEVWTGKHVCTRCGRERQRKNRDMHEQCFDCRQVERDLAEMEGVA